MNIYFSLVDSVRRLRQVKYLLRDVKIKTRNLVTSDATVFFSNSW